jgi:hypothetical protein
VGALYFFGGWMFGYLKYQIAVARPDIQRPQKKRRQL